MILYLINSSQNFTFNSPPPPLYNRYESRGDLVFIYQTIGNF